MKQENTFGNNIRFYDIKRWARTSLLKNSRLYHTIRFLTKKKKENKYINFFAGEDISANRRKELQKLMRTAMIKYHWEFDEFFLFDFEHSSEEERKLFVPEFEKNVFCDQINDPRQADVFLDKWTTYEHYKKFFRRDVINIRSLTDLENDDFRTFVEKHKDFILKPVFAALGHGIRIVRTADFNDAKRQIQAVFNFGITAFILEELIIQEKTMASFHPSSVNTLRIPTLRFDDRVEIIHPRIRLGRGDSVVDNAGSGGIIGNIDLESGVVYAACDKKGIKYDTHPDTGVSIVGFKVPQFEEAVEMVKEMSQVLPKVRYVGWDLALRDDGWVMIEGNDKGQLGFQYPNHEGFADELEKYRKELLGY
jgi:hypothetical protein